MAALALVPNACASPPAPPGPDTTSLALVRFDELCRYRSWSRSYAESRPDAATPYVVGDAYEHRGHHAFDIRCRDIGTLQLQLPMLFGLHVFL